MKQDQYLENLFSLRTSTAVVTGASFGGLGHYHALTLAKAGANVVAADLPSRKADLERTVKAIGDVSAKRIKCYVDVSSEDSIREMVSLAVEKFGKIDILLNNAGVSWDVPSTEMKLSDWEKVVRANLTGPFLCSREVARHMIKHGIEGRIINIASIYGKVADFDPSAPYYATKAAIINLTRALAVEWAQHGIRVNSIAPGYFPSRMTRFVSENPRIKKRFMARIPLRKPGRPDVDLSGALLLFASDKATKYLTGQTLFVDGGWTSV